MVFGLSVTSCEKPCTKSQTIFSLIGFADAEADTIILRRFTKGDSFSQPLDTVLLDNIQFDRSNDTLTIVAISGSASLLSDYNYQIFFPGAAKLLNVTDIIENENTATEGIFSCTKKDACMNTISGYTVNGQFNNTVESGYLIYLKK